MCSCRLAELLTPGSTTGTAATSRSRCPGTGPAGQFTKTAGLPLTLESVTGPYFAEKVPEVGQSLPPAARLSAGSWPPQMGCGVLIED
jgi:hypothetical protein